MTTLRPFQKIRQQVTFCLIAVLSSTQVRSSAADVYLNGRGDGLNSGASYMAWAVPGSGDTVIVGANNPTGYTLNALPTGSSLSLNGFRVVAGATGTTTFQAFNTTGTTTQTLNIGSGGIDMSQATQNLTLNQTNGNGTLALNLTAAQNWLVGAGRTLTVNSNISGLGGLNLTTTGTGAIATLAGVIWPIGE